MLTNKGQNSRILLTTPDYPPRLGGLSTFTLLVEKALKNLGLPYDLYHWKDIQDLKSAQLTKKYQHGIHIHFMGSYYLNDFCEKHINFIHGSEILFTSPKWYKKLFKFLFKKFFLRKLQSCKYNICISEFTLKKLEFAGLSIDYSRDFVFHNCIDFQNKKELSLVSLSDPVLKFICVARDVPHKNLSGAFDLCLKAAQTTGKPVELYCPKAFPEHPLVKTISLDKLSDEERDSLYQACHFNLLLSLDHSYKGFYEGFGLTVLEAGRFGTPSIVSSHGGLPEACHHGKTGWVLPLNPKNFSRFFQNLTEEEYLRIAKQCYNHTLQSHHSGHYDELIKGVLR